MEYAQKEKELMDYFRTKRKDLERVRNKLVELEQHLQGEQLELLKQIASILEETEGDMTVLSEDIDSVKIYNHSNIDWRNLKGWED